MLVEPFLGRLVVIGRHREESAGAGLSELACELNDFLRVVTARSGEDWHLVAGFLGKDLDDAPALGGRERRVLAGRAARREEMDAGVDLATAQTPHCRFVEVAAPRKRRDECRARPGKWRSHSAIPFL